MNQSKQPEALRLADNLEANRCHQAARELRRLHARVQELETDLKKANAQAEHFEREWYLRGDEMEASQAQRMPLSDAAIRDLYSEEVHWDLVAPYVIAFARSIEAAHGITQEKQG